MIVAAKKFEANLGTDIIKPKSITRARYVPPQIQFLFFSPLYNLCPMAVEMCLLVLLRIRYSVR